MRSRSASRSVLGLALISVFCLGTTAQPTVLVPDDFPTIQGAIDAASDGWTILVGPGTYVENLDYRSKPIILRSTDGPSVTVIDGSKPSDPDASSVVQVSNVSFLEDPVIDGFTLTGGQGTGGGVRCGGGIFLSAASLTVVNCRILDNRADRGGGAYCFASQIVLEDTVFDNNSAGAGGGLYFYEALVTCTKCDFRNNSALGKEHLRGVLEGAGGAVYSLDEFHGSFVQCTFVSNLAEFGGAYYSVDPFSIVEPADVIFVSCLFFGNRAENHGGAVHSRQVDRCVLQGCTLVQNSAMLGGGAICTCGVPGRRSLSLPSLSNCVLWDNQPDQIMGNPFVCFSILRESVPGTGNIIGNPMFVDPSIGDFRLAPGSVAIDRGDPLLTGADRMDLDGSARGVDGDRDGTTTLDMGCFEYQPQPFDARLGNVNTADGGVNRADVLLLNGLPGDSEGVATVGLDEPFQLDIVAPPSRSAPMRSSYVVYVWVGEPGQHAVSVQQRAGFFLGWTAFPTVFSGGLPQPVRLWNTFGHEPFLGDPDFVSDKAPTTLFSLPNGRSIPITATFQGFVEDDAAPTDFGVATTNAVVLRVE